MYFYVICMHACMTEESIREKRESDPIIDGGELPCGCWLLNSGSSEEQSVLLTTEPFLLSLGSDFFFVGDIVSLCVQFWSLSWN